ncbi:carbon starvation protein A [Idiomarina loihiensis]|jgi:carbon starvation protein|uniref:Carbon starvation regulatory protein n=1 Tax=Idiomarina loihiensis (strain ATCC BAA-735 / DSM 15497 / L2-TR) TaxID=283942 RepID=Q5R0F2_IDILO|nr:MULTISPECIES: carbon starvation protein A [Idiomarina]NWO02728.1 carbon starvation protein A [Idiomarinaceae bacterium]AAV81538.1 Carbon starvation regulatory protein [Idiomarina loihiensis L2TR]AGM35566.1 carbon starvation protein CstA [Idiomarina loihiensis GSL 199]MBL4856995.1 carbon starvation protein A [Idiomarina sp.]MRJ43839.1 carbon starvation protein A [Idiomarina loihiensis]|tara:strand:+ start:29834 stop:31513 length:1680 start_codon:yes stop_codon:yes gene_type:complete
MNAIVMMVLGLGAMFLGYVFYSKFIAEKIFKLDPNFRTPAHELEDGVDFVPTNKYVLWGHHFTSVAGAAPIIGPAIAVIWGWVPAFLWVIFGTIFFAGVHDAGAIWASNRNKAKSIGNLTGDVVGKRSQTLFMIVIFLVLLMVNAVFATAISGLLIKFSSSVVPVWGAIFVALIIGQIIFRKWMGLGAISIIGVLALYALIWAGPSFPIELPETVMGISDNAQWVLILFGYAAIASLLPVWMLLQPRDYINGLQLFIGLILLYGATLLLAPEISAPAFNSNTPEGTPSMLPLLFVTIACGAISGFHGLVASGTTSKQLDKETDARFVGYFGAVGEGSLSLATIIAATAGFATLADWEAVYSSFGQGGVSAFVEGGANIISQGLGLDIGVSETLLTVMAVLFAGTTMDTGLRLQRYIFQEWGNLYNINWMQKAFPATMLAVGSCLLLAFGAGGADGSGGLVIWPLFGTTNQLLAGLTLLVITVMLVRLGRPMYYTLIPLIFLLIMTVFALIVQLKDFYNSGDWFLMGLDLVVLVAAIWIALEASAGLTKIRKEQKAQKQQ